MATAGAVRAVGLEVGPDPIPDDPGHTLIRDGAESLTRQAVRKQLAVLFQFLPA